MNIDRTLNLLAAIALAAFANAALLDVLITPILLDCSNSAFLPRVLLFTLALWLLLGGFVAFYWSNTKVHRWLIGVPSFGALTAILIGPFVWEPTALMLLINLFLAIAIVLLAAISGLPVFLGALAATSAALRAWPHYRLAILAGVTAATVAPFSAFLWSNPELGCIFRS